jgi:hypothetical protein
VPLALTHRARRQEYTQLQAVELREPAVRRTLTPLHGRWGCTIMCRVTDVSWW